LLDGNRLILVTCAASFSLGRACTVTSAGWPTFTFPMLDSLNGTTSCIPLTLISVMNAELPVPAEPVEQLKAAPEPLLEAPDPLEEPAAPGAPLAVELARALPVDWAAPFAGVLVLLVQIVTVTFFAGVAIVPFANLVVAPFVGVVVLLVQVVVVTPAPGALAALVVVLGACPWRASGACSSPTWWTPLDPLTRPVGNQHGPRRRGRRRRIRGRRSRRAARAGAGGRRAARIGDRLCELGLSS
jgi:hypothetical protein